MLNFTPLINLLLHLFLLFSLLLLSWILIVKDEEEKALQEAIEGQLRPMKIPDNIKIPTNIFEHLEKKFSKPDADKELQNQKTLTSAFIFISTVGVLMLLFLAYGRATNLMQIIAENTWLVIISAVVDLIFFLYVGKKYIPLTPSELVNSLSS